VFFLQATAEVPIQNKMDSSRWASFRNEFLLYNFGLRYKSY